MKKTGKKKGRKQERDFCTYCVKILDWEVPYSISLNRGKSITIGPFWEHVNLRIKGHLLYPEKIAGELPLSFLGSREENDYLKNPDKYASWEPNAVGHLTIRGKQRNFLGSLPQDIFPILIAGLSAEKYCHIILNGHVLYRGGAYIDSINFEREYDPEDWV